MSEGQGHSTGRLTVLAALAANLSIAIAKFVAFAVTGSSSMGAEAVHSLADSGNQVLLLVGGRASRKQPDVLHPFGYGSARFVYAFIVSVVLFVLGGAFALYEGIHKLLDPHPIKDGWWAIGVLAFAFIAESFSFRTAIRESSGLRRGRSWVGFIRDVKIPELPVVLMEDSAALAGLLFALAGVSISIATHNGVWDGLGSIAIGALLVVVAVILGIQMSSLLIGEAAAPEDVRAIETALLESKSVIRVIHLRTLHIGPEQLVVAAKIAVSHDDTAAHIAREIDAAEVRVRAAVPMADLIFIEPDIYDATRDPGFTGTT
jgi:cation diffusion facilitator family transporter